MPQAVKFEFDRDFSGREVVRTPKQRKKTRWNEEEVEAIRAEAYAEGEAAGRESEAAEAARQVSASAATLVEQAKQLVTTLSSEHAMLRDEAAAIALVTARKLVPALMATAPTKEIEAVVADSLALMRDAPRVVVEIAPEHVSELEPLLNETAAGQGFEGNLVVRANENIGAGDVRLLWDGGEIVRDTPALEARIEQIIADYLNAPTNEETEQSDFFSLLGVEKNGG